MTMSERYNRQILLFGEEAQRRLSTSRVFIAGVGGLGSPVSVYLAIAGIGTIVIADCATGATRSSVSSGDTARCVSFV